MWTNFYGKLSEIDCYSSKNPPALFDSATNQSGFSVESLTPEALFAREMEKVLTESDRIFSGEEGHGKYFDLHKHYHTFCNIKKLRQLNIVKADDYLTWLQNVEKFTLVPLYVKQSSKYESYISELCDYL